MGKKASGTEDPQGTESPAPPQDLDEKLIFDGYAFAVNAISTLVRTGIFFSLCDKNFLQSILFPLIEMEDLCNSSYTALHNVINR